MKAILIILVVILGLFMLINNAPMTDGMGTAGDKVLLPVRYAGLLSKPAEEKIAVPVRGIKPNQITNTFGAPRGADREHQGQDIFARKGTPVHSATEGYVIRLGQNNLGGNIVSIVGAGGRVYYYAHLDSHAPDLKVGDFVTPETVLGYVGTTGNAQGTPPHLHFGVYTMNGAIDPLSLF